MKRNLYTAADDAVIIKHVKKHGNNLRHAHEEAAKELGRTYGAVMVRWYSYLKNTASVISVMSENKKTIGNQKNYARGRNEDLTVGIFSKMIQSITPKQKQAFRDQFFKAMFD